MGVGNGDVSVWREVLRKVMLEAGVADWEDDASGRLLDRPSVLRFFSVDVRCVMSEGEENVLVLSLSIGVGVEYPELEECVECRGVEPAVFPACWSWASCWVS